LALGKNTGLKTVSVNVGNSMDESLCTAIKDGLGTNATLESLEVKDVLLRDDTTVLWYRAFSFLRTNKAIKSFEIGVQRNGEESCVSAFRVNITAMLQENTPLESLSIQNMYGRFEAIDAEEYITLVTVLQHNTTLKTLSLSLLDRR
jgi:hypothetical protein